jgi:UDP-2,3-diacylglucosamine pyrophosphatase LpxH
VVIYYIPGNHDSSVGIFDGESFGNIHIKREMVIDTGKEKVLVVHGDEFDIVLRSMVYLYSVGEFIYDFLVDFNPLYIRFRKILGMRGDFSLSYYLKHVSRNIIEYLSKYEKLIAKKAEMNGCGVVICGHSHFAEDRIIDGIRYMNCGSWTIDNTASLIVDNNGTLELIRYRD